MVDFELIDTGQNTRKRTHARTRIRLWKKRNIIRFGCWNITSWNKHDQEVIAEMNRQNIDVCALTETKKKGKGNTKYGNYPLVYSGKRKEERAEKGVALIIHEKFEKNIEDVDYIDERILHVTLNLQEGKINIISIYAPDISKSKDIREAFLNKMQDLLTSIPIEEKYSYWATSTQE